MQRKHLKTIQQPFLMKTLRKVGLEENFLSKWKSLTKNLQQTTSLVVKR